MEQATSVRSGLKSFTDLNAWKEAHSLAQIIYSVTECFPKSDMFGLSQQMQRAVLSVTSNIAEGFGRQTKADTLHFYVMSRGSLIELQNQILLARDTGKLAEREAEDIYSQTVVVVKLIGGLIRSTKKLTSS